MAFVRLSLYRDKKYSIKIKNSFWMVSDARFNITDKDLLLELTS